jgi:hypothetical protein
VNVGDRAAFRCPFAICIENYPTFMEVNVSDLIFFVFGSLTLNFQEKKFSLQLLMKNVGDRAAFRCPHREFFCFSSTFIHANVSHLILLLFRSLTLNLQEKKFSLQLLIINVWDRARFRCPHREFFSFSSTVIHANVSHLILLLFRSLTLNLQEKKFSLQLLIINVWDRARFRCPFPICIENSSTFINANETAT